MFRLKLLGGALIEGPAGVLSGRITQRRRIALLAPLAVARGRPVSRDKLLALLWPDTDSEHARRLLSDSVYLIRKELGDLALVTAGNDLRLDPTRVSSDVGEFEQAVSLYDGPFLDGFHINDAPEFEHWLDVERERLSRSCARLLEMLAQESESGGDFAAAADWWRRLAAHEPTSGRVALGVMRALDAAGDRAGAIQHARTHTIILREQFGIDADPDVTSLADGLRTGAIPRMPQAMPNFGSAAEPEAELTAASQPAATDPTTATANADARDALAQQPLAIPSRRARHIKWVALIGAGAIVAFLSESTGHNGPDVIVVADVARDTRIGDFVSTLLRQEFARSPQLSVMGRPAIAATLQRMGRDPNTRLVPELAQEVALREGAKAFVGVDVVAVGDAAHLSAALFSADGELLDADAIIAFDSTEVLSAAKHLVERVSRQFPGRIASMQSRDRLPPVTTNSIRALLKHHEAFMVWRIRGDALRAIELAEEAIAIDPAFAQAYLYLSWYLGEEHGQSRRALAALLEAYRLRERLSPYERYAVEAFYYARAEGDFMRAVGRYRAHIVEAKKFGPKQVVTSFLSLANLHVLLGDLDEAERTLQESREWFPGPFNQAFLVRVLYSQGRDKDAREVLEAALATFPENAWPKTARVHLVAASGDDEQAHALALNIDARHDLPFGLRTAALFDAKHGRLAEANGHLREIEKQMLEQNLVDGAIHVAVARARLRLIAKDTVGAVSQIEEFLSHQPTDSVGALGQPALMVARFFACANRPRRANEFLAAYDRFLPEALEKSEPWLLRQTRAQLALRTGNPDGAIAELRSGPPQIHWNEWYEEPFLPVESRPELARAWEQAGQQDSAIAVYERYLNARPLFRVVLDAFELAGAYQRLAALYENRNDFARAAEYHRKLANLWRNADAPLRQQAEALLRRAESLETDRAEAATGIG
jgi:DNA-binding SARP family transcriptional activator